MADALTTTMTLRLETNYVNTLDLSRTTNLITSSDGNWSDTLADGVGLDQADLTWNDTRTATGAVDDIDLNGTETGIFSATVDFVKIKMIAIKNNSVVVGETLTVGAAAAFPLGGWVADAATDKVVIQPGGIFLMWAPSLAAYACGAGASDVLRVDPGANTISYDIIIVGTTA